jgi:hypothetical protein
MLIASLPERSAPAHSGHRIHPAQKEARTRAGYRSGSAEPDPAGTPAPSALAVKIPGMAGWIRTVPLVGELLPTTVTRASPLADPAGTGS